MLFQWVVTLALKTKYDFPQITDGKPEPSEERERTQGHVGS